MRADGSVAGGVSEGGKRSAARVGNVNGKEIPFLLKNYGAYIVRRMNLTALNEQFLNVLLHDFTQYYTSKASI